MVISLEAEFNDLNGQYKGLVEATKADALQGRHNEPDSAARAKELLVVIQNLQQKVEYFPSNAFFVRIFRASLTFALAFLYFSPATALLSPLFFFHVSPRATSSI